MEPPGAVPASRPDLSSDGEYVPERRPRLETRMQRLHENERLDPER
ncbi:hypothetical protein [Natronococcus sp.]|nr:hypothetical protein [Natronococcus sp.]